VARSNEKPPTLQRPRVGVDGLKIHGAAKVTELPIGTLTKLPVVVPTKANQELTRVAVAKEVVLNVAAPEKPRSPVIGVA